MNEAIEAAALLPCPFCGGEAQRITLSKDDGPGNAGGDVVCCTRCNASSHVEFGRKENLVSHWNTRAVPRATGNDAELVARTEAERGRLIDRIDARDDRIEALTAEMIEAREALGFMVTAFAGYADTPGKAEAVALAQETLLRLPDAEKEKRHD